MRTTEAPAALYDHNGKPIVRKLLREQATGALTSVRSPYADLVAPGLTPRKLQNLIARAVSGDHGDYLLLADEMEKRDSNYFAALQTRKLAVQGLKRSVVAPSEAAEDTKVAAAVDSFVQSAAFGRALLDVLDATAKGFSVVEILWSRAQDLWQPGDYKHRPQRWFFFERERLSELRLHDGSLEGEALDACKYIVHVPHVFSGSPLAGGLARIVATLHLFRGYALKDWLAFAEVFGIPLRVGRYDEAASEEQKEELKRAVRNIGSDAAAIIPKTMELEFLRAQGSGFAGSDQFFPTMAGWMNRETVKAVLGSNFTDEEGGSFAKAIALNELRLDLRNSDAWQLADTVNRDLVRPFVDLNFGKRLRDSDYPRVDFDTSEPEDLKHLADALTPFIKLGLPVSVASILEKFGLTMPEPDEPILRAPAPTTAGDSREQGDDGDDEQAAARVGELQAMLARVAREAETSTNMRQFRRQLRGLLPLQKGE